MKGLLSKRFVILGKEVSALLLILIALGGVASAALLTYYGIITGTVKVTQSLVISDNGQNWKECTGGSYGQCTIDYGQVSIIGGEKKTIDQHKLYVRNNIPDKQISFSVKGTFHKDLADGLKSLRLNWIIYQSQSGDPDCDQWSDISLTGLSCQGDSCTLTLPYTLPAASTLKFCKVEIETDPKTIPNNYDIRIEILPQ